LKKSGIASSKHRASAFSRLPEKSANVPGEVALLDMDSKTRIKQKSKLLSADRGRR
jgi:hypothetical protein